MNWFISFFFISNSFKLFPSNSFISQFPPFNPDLQAEKVHEKSEEIHREIQENPDLIKKLNHVVPEEKNPLPTKEQIEAEKQLEEQAKQA